MKIAHSAILHNFHGNLSAGWQHFGFRRNWKGRHSVTEGQRNSTTRQGRAPLLTVLLTSTLHLFFSPSFPFPNHFESRIEPVHESLQLFSRAVEDPAHHSSICKRGNEVRSVRDDLSLRPSLLFFPLRRQMHVAFGIDARNFNDASSRIQPRPPTTPRTTCLCMLTTKDAERFVETRSIPPARYS